MADWDEQLGKVCNITVIHAQGKGANAKNTYANIGTISPIPAKYADNVGEALTTDMCTGDADDNSNYDNDDVDDDIIIYCNVS